MTQPTRRQVMSAMAIMCIAERIFAQGKCSASGMTLDEALAAWQDAKKAADLDKSSFLITIKRTSRATFKGKDKGGEEIVANGVLGTLTVNGVVLGDVLENEALRVPAGNYRGVMRYGSEKNFVQGPLGTMAESGDFLLEVSGIKGRTNILLHSGTKPWHSKGCILAGSARRSMVDGKALVTIGDDTTLRAVRQKFYGADVPVACPNRAIRVSIADIP